MFLSKPLDVDELKQNIDDIINLKKDFESNTFINKLDGILELPSIPYIYIKKKKKLSSVETSFKEIGKIISEDISMTAKILQIVNSAFFGIPQKIGNVEQALKYLGFNQIKSLVLYIKIFSMLNLNVSKKTNVNMLWQHSLCSAVISSEIARLNNFPRSDVEDAYFAGLLHDIGKIILLKLDDYSDNIGYFNSEYKDVLESEKERFGIDHSQVGKYILGIWNLPENIVQCVGDHHIIDNIPGNNLNLIEIVSIANKISNELSNNPETFLSLDSAQKNELINNYLSDTGDSNG